MRRILREHRCIALVLALFIGLGIWYSVTTPLFEAPDEVWHFAYVQYVATGRGLPVQTLDQPAHLARQEGSQPPLYYALASAATFWIDTSDYPGIVWNNPHYGYNVPGIVDDNKNLFIHTSIESLPYRGAVLAIHLARWLSVLMGALAVLFTYLLALELFPERKYLAAGAGALVAFVPQFLFISSAVSNDSTIVALSAAALWLMVRLFRIQPTTRDAVVLGIVVGLAALSKVSGAGLGVLAVLALVAVEWRDRRRLAVHLAALLAAGGLVAGWWYLRNLFLYGELTGTDMMVRIFGARQTPLTLTQLLVQLNEVWETFWVGFGWGNIRANPVIYTLLAVLIVFCVIGLLVGLAKNRADLSGLRRPDRSRSWLGVQALPIFVLVLWIAIVSAELLHWMMVTQAPHGRLLFPILPAAAPLALLGLMQWAPARWQPVAVRAMPAALFVLAASAPIAILLPAYAYPVELSASEVQNLQHRVDINYDGKMMLLGYDISPRTAQPGQAFTLTLYWQSLAAMDADYSIGIHLLDANQHVIGARDSYPGHGMLPTRLWRPGEIIRDIYWMPVAADAPAPSTAQIQVALYQRETKRDLTAHDPRGQVVTPNIARIKLTGMGAAIVVHPQNTTPYVFGKQIALIGYDLTKPDAGSSNLKLTLYWKRIAPVGNDYTVFVHVLGGDNRIAAQKDQMPEAGDNPTSLWEDGETVIDPYPFDLPAGGSGTYQIEVGLYRAETSERLSVIDGNGKPSGDHVILGSFEVGP